MRHTFRYLVADAARRGAGADAVARRLAPPGAGRAPPPRRRDRAHRRRRPHCGRRWSWRRASGPTVRVGAPRPAPRAVGRLPVPGADRLGPGRPGRREGRRAGRARGGADRQRARRPRCRRRTPGSGGASAWLRVAAAAARQSGQVWLPRLRGLVPFGDALAEIPTGEGCLIDPRGDAAISAVAGRSGRAALLVGPQAGFSEAEVERAREAGPRRLRAGPGGAAHRDGGPRGGHPGPRAGRTAAGRAA